MSDIVERLRAERDERTSEVARLLIENERLRLRVKFLEDELKCPAALEPKPDLRALLPELAVIRQVMKEPKS